jgi:hypothetical protein
MPEVAEQKQPEAAASVAPPVANNPFDESSWVSEPPKPTEQPAQQQSQETSQQSAPPRQEEEIVYVDSNEYIKQHLGYDNWDAAKTEIAELRQLREKAQTPAEIKFANEQSQKFFDLLREGKTDDVYSFLHQQKQLERLEKMELTSVNEAAEIIKANLQFKYKDLTPKEIERLYNREYSLPEQPRRDIDETDDEYQHRVDEWKFKVQEKEQDILINAKIARPELVKFKSELVLPEIPKQQAATEQQIDPKVLESMEAARKLFLQSVDSDYNKFSGFETKVKDESVELPVAFKVPDEDKVAYANKLKNFNINDFFESRWFDEKGNANVGQMMADIYLIENPGKVFQGLANNAASLRLENHLKTKSNIKVDGGAAPTNIVTQKDVQLKQEEALWNA